jgi:hypothetical protein
MGSNFDWVGQGSVYSACEKRIRDSVIAISNEGELSQGDTVAILTYLIHDILSIKNDAPDSGK